MVDVTARFYALAGWGLPPSTSSLIGRNEVYLLSAKLLGDVGHIESPQIFRHQLEDIEAKLGVGGSYSSSQGHVKLVEEGIVKALYECLNVMLVEYQQKSAEKLHREMAIQKHFAPDLKRIASTKTASIIPKQTVVDDVALVPDEKLASEEEVLLATYMLESDQTVELQRNVVELGAMISALSVKVVEQSEIASSVLDVALESVAHIDRADDQLVKAKKHTGGLTFYLLCWFWSLTIILWALHLIRR